MGCKLFWLVLGAFPEYFLEQQALGGYRELETSEKVTWLSLQYTS